MRGTLLSLLSWFFVIGLVSFAHAAPKEPPAYTEAVELGVSEFEAHNFVEARAHFARAHALYPNARTLRALGMVAFELKRYDESIGYLMQALASDARTLEGEKRKQTEKLVERANGYIARFNLDIASDTVVFVDNVETRLGPGSELVLEVGDHTLEFRAPKRIASKRRITVQGGERETLHVALAALTEPDKPKAASSSTTPDPAPEKATSRAAYKNPWLWTALGVVVAGAATGTAIALTSGGTTTKAEPHYTGTGGAPALGTPR